MIKRDRRIAGVAVVAGLLLLAIALAAPTPARAAAGDLQQLLQELQQARERRQQRAQQRINDFIERVNKRERMLQQAIAERNALRQRREQLQQAFEQNQKKIEALTEKLQKRKGEFGEVLGVIRQVAADARAIMRTSFSAAQHPERAEFLAKLADSKGLPSIEQINRLWHVLLRQMVASAQIERFSSQIVLPDGTRTRAEVMRVGPFTAFVGNRFLGFEPSTQALYVLPRQPAGRWREMAYNLYTASGEGSVVSAPIDPSRGAILSRLIQKPTLLERVQQGGLVGYVIIAIAIIGLLLILERFIVLGRTERRMRRQRKNPDDPRGDNPLGEVLQAYHANRDADTETLQLKLDEAILRRLPRLERGLASIRIFSAVAPMLGLLGTVIGMIAVFQAITLFGTGDPKLMAGGISKALVTTALGLVTAVPLIVLHSTLNGRSRRLIQMLEHQASGIVARHAEAQAKADE